MPSRNDGAINSQPCFSVIKVVIFYFAVLSKNGRWDFNHRQEKFNNPYVINMEYVPLDESMIETLWPIVSSYQREDGSYFFLQFWSLAFTFVLSFLMSECIN